MEARSLGIDVKFKIIFRYSLLHITSPLVLERTFLIKAVVKISSKALEISHKKVVGLFKLNWIRNDQNH